MDPVDRLLDELLDPARSVPVVGISMAVDRTEPLVDVTAVRDGVGSRALVFVLTTGEQTWRLKRALPRGLDVFGDAVRVWRPHLLTGSPIDHPLRLLDEDDDPVEAARAVVELVSADDVNEVRATVVHVGPEDATLRLSNGREARLGRDQLSRHDLHPWQVLRPAQTVRMLVTAPQERDRLTGTLLPFEPDPALRLAEVAPGTLLRARVRRRERGLAEVGLLPSVSGTVVIPDAPRGASDQFFAEDEVVVVRLVRHGAGGPELEPAQPRPGEAPLALSIYPDGPSWLDDPPVAFELSPLPPALDAPEVDHAARATGAAGPGSSAELGSELVALADLVQRAADERRRVRAQVDATVTEVARLRWEAQRLKAGLEDDLVELRHRVLETLEDESSTVLSDTVTALAEAQREIGELRSLLAESARDQARREGQLQDALARVDEDQRALTRVRAEAAQQRERITYLQRQLRLWVPTEDRLVEAIREAWAKLSTPADRDAYPWTDPLIGPHFIPSMDRLEGVGWERVIDVAAEVVSGRAKHRRGLQVHPLRSAQSGGSAQRRRGDGAVAFRASLQVRTSAARRLHYWVLPSGQVELAQVGYHDDFSIA